MGFRRPKPMKVLRNERALARRAALPAHMPPGLVCWDLALPGLLVLVWPGVWSALPANFPWSFLMGCSRHTSCSVRCVCVNKRMKMNARMYERCMSCSRHTCRLGGA
eukprot:1151759-Pelagomonas_calceolata.AAC.4